MAGRSVGDLAEVLHRSKLRAVWLVPARGARPSEADLPILREWARLNPAHLRREHPELVWQELTARGPQGAGAVLGGLVTHRAGEGACRCLYALWPQDAWAITDKLAGLPPDPAARARIVAAAFMLAEWSLGAQLWFSPAHTGLTLMRECLQHWARPENGAAVEPLDVEWQRRFRGELRTSDVRWARTVTAEEITAPAVQPARPEGMAALWVYDRNMSYVSSARIPLPLGEPTPTLTYQRDLPGVYLLDATAPPGWDPCLPGPFHVGEDAGAYPLIVQKTWAWEPFVRLALDHGWEVQIRKGQYWPKHQTHALLRTWGDRVWDARESAEQHKAGRGEAALVGTLATAIIKRVGVASVGRLKPKDGRAVMTSEEAEGRGLPTVWDLTDEDGRLTGLVEARTPFGRTDLQHPEWWSAIIGHASARLLSVTYGSAPECTAGLYIDSLYCTRPVMDRVLNNDRTARGSFRSKGMALVPREVLATGTFMQLVKAAKEGLGG